MIAGFLIVVAYCLGLCAVFLAIYALVKWHDDRQNRQARADFPGLHRTAAEDEAWEQHVARAPGFPIHGSAMRGFESHFAHTHSEDR